MKLLTYIFALYILLLPCMPCMDSGACNTPAIPTITGTATSHSDHQHDNEACNPFCTCACCGHIAVVSFTPGKPLPVKPVRTGSLSFLYNSIALPSDYFGNIWQPPRSC